MLCDYALSLHLDAVVLIIAGKLVLCDYALSLSTLMLPEHHCITQHEFTSDDQDDSIKVET